MTLSDRLAAMEQRRQRCSAVLDVGGTEQALLGADIDCLLAALRRLASSIEYAHRLHTGEWMPDEPSNCAHPSCSALAALDRLAEEEQSA